jgi:hypothetical protein
MPPAHRTLRDVAHTLGVAPQTVHRWRATGVAGIRLTCWRKGGRWMVNDADLTTFLSAVTSVRSEGNPPPTAVRKPNDAAQALAALKW